jgi:manganese/zinc/iron transport system permease protein
MSYEGWILLTGALVGVACGTIGSLLILRKMAMLSDAISHTVLLGIVAAYLISHTMDGLYMLVGAGIVGMLTALLVQVLDSSGVQSDAAIGIVFTSLFALGVVLLTLFAGRVHLDANHALMGEIAFVPWDTTAIFGLSMPKAVWMLCAVLIINLSILFLFYKEIKLASFDSQMAVALGINVTFIHYLLMGMVSISTVASFDSVGAILVVTMLIAPGATAYLLTDKLSVMIALSGVIGAIAAMLGYYLAVWWNASISGSMSTVAGLIFALVFVLSPKHGLLSKWRAGYKVFHF